MANFDDVSAIILAAGLSSRMGTPKLSLPWQDTTIIGKVISTLQSAGIKDKIVVTRPSLPNILASIRPLISHYSFRIIFINESLPDDMVASIQTGLKSVDSYCNHALVVLGDQPFLKKETIISLIAKKDETGMPLVIPSYMNHRGHPWLISKSIWPRFLNLHHPESARDFINQHADQIAYVSVDDNHLLLDIDTPEDYHDLKPGNNDIQFHSSE